MIVIVATDAPLLPHQCRRLAQRAGLGIARTGGAGENSSGDGFLAFSTANRGRLPSDALGANPPRVLNVEALADTYLDPLFHGTIEATEEAVVSALLAAETMTGRDGVTAHALAPGRLLTAYDAGVRALRVDIGLARPPGTSVSPEAGGVGSPYRRRLT